VQLAQRLTRAPEPVPVPEGLGNPFNPVGFAQGDADDGRSTPATQGRGGQLAPGGSAAPSASPAAPQSEREILELLAAKLPTKGTIILNGEPLLILTGGRVKVGDSSPSPSVATTTSSSWSQLNAPRLRSDTTAKKSSAPSRINNSP
jgi:hypothetical protein